jgi:hypothetical protein
MINDMKLKTLISFPNPGDQFLKPMKGPSIYFIKFRIRNAVFLRIEVVEIS